MEEKETDEEEKEADEDVDSRWFSPCQLVWLSSSIKRWNKSWNNEKKEKQKGEKKRKARRSRILRVIIK